MAFPKERKQFTQCAESYRIFLKKFSEKPSFDHESIGATLSHVYNTMYKRRGPVPWDSKFRLVNTILLNEQKILDDLETMTRFPKCVMATLASTAVSFGTVKKLVTEILNDRDDYDRYDDEDLINVVCKQFRFSSSSENVKRIIRRLKENYVRQRKNNRKISYLHSPIRERKMSLRQTVQRMLNPVVLVKKDKRLQEMGKKFKILKREREESRSIKESDDERCDRYCTGNLNDEMHAGSNEKDIEQNNTSQDKDLSQKDGLVFIKQEIDLIDTPQLSPEAAPTQNECNEKQCSNDGSSQIEVNSQSSQTIESSSTLTMTNDQESTSAMRTTNNNNNFIPTMQLTNNVRFIPHAALMFNTSCNAYMMMPISQFQPNIVMINNGINGYYPGMFNNPMLFNNPFVQNPMLAAQNFSIMPEQQLFFNQGLNPPQEIVQLQSTLESLNSQINSLGNTLVSQMHKN